MKICLVHEEYPEETNFGGIATYQKVVAEQLVKEGHEVTVISRGLTENKNYIENGVNIIRVFVKDSKTKKGYIRYRKKVAKILYKLQKQQKIDIIEVPDWGAETIYFEKKRKIPLVVRLHTPLKIWLQYNQNSFGKIKDLMLSWEEKMINQANYITCCSLALKKLIVDEFDIPKSKIHVTPNPANITNFYREKNQKKEDSILYVGSLEERKGVYVLARAMNIVFKKYPNLKIKFVGKDTNRNHKNISTKALIYDNIQKKYRKNIEFIGQVENKKVNHYLNTSKVAVFPSLFDNFPYVVLEAMSTGIQIVGSRNSGMVEMLNDETSIYDTGDYKDLAEKIINKYELSKDQEYNIDNINRVKEQYNPYEVCNNLIKMYQEIIQNYNQKLKITLQDVLNTTIQNEQIKKYKREKSGLANHVYRVQTNENIYIIKRYLNNYNFDIANQLYDKYNQANINAVRPINENIITYKGNKYNIFKYYKRSKKIKKLNIEYLSKLLCLERSTDTNTMLLNKCNKYYTYLQNNKNITKVSQDDLDYVLNIYKKLKQEKILTEKYLNHGDLSKENILKTKETLLIIDFDESVVTTPLYDFAVIMIKMFIKKNRINKKVYKELKNNLKEKYPKYTDNDFINIIKVYLCKIIMEKLYLHSKNKINIFSRKQKKDSYSKYLKILRKLEESGEYI